jgi:hypothetical protein
MILLRPATAWRSKLAPALLAAVLAGCAPSVRAPDIWLKSMSARTPDQTVLDLGIYNPNRFPLRVMSVDYQVSVGDRPCGSGRRDEPLFLDARDTTNAEFILSIDWSGVASALPALLSDSVVLGVKGSYVAATLLGRRRFRFAESRTVSVKDELNSLIRSLF